MGASFGSTWGEIGRVVALTTSAYATLLVGTRLAGRRTLSQMSAYDVLVTIALGTILGTIALSPDVSFAEGVAAIGTLLALQVLLGLVRRSQALRRVLDFRPRTVVEHGDVSLSKSPLGPQMTHDELRSLLRLRGAFDQRAVERAVLEPVGGVSVQTKPAAATDASLSRTTRTVVESHLRCRKHGDLERDLRENYALDVVLLSWEGVNHGHDGVRKLAGILRSYVESAKYRYEQLLVDGDVAMLRWSADGEEVEVHDGADSYVVRDGRIVAQTIHYSTREAAPPQR